MRRAPLLRFRDQVANDVLIAGAEYAGGVHVAGCRRSDRVDKWRRLDPWAEPITHPLPAP